MSGVVVIVNIPTQVEEKALRDKPKKLQFDLTEDHGSLPQNGVKSVAPNLDMPPKEPTPAAKSTDMPSYGPFGIKLLTPVPTPKRAHSNEMIAINMDTINIAASVDNLQNAEQKPLLGAEDHNDSNLQKTKSFEHLGNKNTLAPKEDKTAFRKSWDGFKEVVSSARKSARKKNKEEEEPIFEFSADSPMEIVLQELLKKFKIDNAVWVRSQNSKSFQVTFVMDADQRHDALLQQFLEWGIGEREGSFVSVLPCSAFYKPTKDVEEDANEESDEIDVQKETAWNKFLSSMRARLNVQQIVEEVKQNAAITFDFVILVMVASILASFGLVEDSTIFLASSMLISPLMGPIIAGIFGTVIKDRKLQYLGVVNELFGIFLATFVGFSFGLIVCSIDDRYGIGEGLTSEMLSRCEIHSIVVGILTAIPSGAAVAIAILGENIGSLVGVAISASLLPPAVNAGVLWALACIYCMFEHDDAKYSSVIKTNFYSDHQGAELAILGSISMCVTITNIICIYVMGILLLKIKEVAPIISRNHRQFWKHDIKLARDYNKTCQSEDAMSFTRKLADEIAGMQGGEDADAHTTGFLKNIGKASYQNTWSPMSARHNISLLDGKPTIQELERLYMTMTKPYQDPRGGTRSSISGGPAKSIIGRNWSPPKLKPLKEEQSILSAIQRRSSMPYEARVSPNKHNSSNYKIHLEKITEVNSSGHDGHESYKDRTEKPDHHKERRKSRKFIVTPAVDTLPQNKN